MILLEDSFKKSGRDVDKVMAPSETLAWVRTRLGSLDVPVLQATERIDKGRLGIPVYASRYAPSISRLTGTHKQMGKGVTAAQAEASAVMELVERFSLFYFVREREKRICSRVDIKARTVAVSEMIKALHVWKQDDPAVSDADPIINAINMEWTEALRPADHQSRWLPFSWFWPINEYNGSASGNSLAEAAVQAISEVVERHVCSVITYGRLTTPTIRSDSLRDPVVKELVDRFRALDINVILKDFSLGLGIPTVGAIAWDPSTWPDRSEIVYTAGTAPDPARAAVRALTEIAQLAGDFDTEGEYLESGLPKFSSLGEAAYVLESSDEISLESMPDCSSENFRIEVVNMCRALTESGLKPYLIDVTHPGLGVPVVYAVIPGNHFRDRTRQIDLPFHCARVASAEKGYAALDKMKLIDEVYPGRPDVAFYTGHVFESLGNYAEALEWYEKAMDRNPGAEETGSILCHRGVCYKEMEDFSRAVEELCSARDASPGLKEIHNLLGYCYYRMGDHLKAIEAFEQAINIDPGSGIDYANIASNLRKLGLREAALQWYEMALELDSELEWAREHMEALKTEQKTE